ncbi:uncharacterized protein LOC117578668 [Drosophila guanche]|uniref:uncharacterized protein LOC117578668 n=1 Tax=Drosophila guanche TaxID=7266 RepID=UPI001471E361|nr:uncharacterized protein LOC117578668 [Drosophila guanche]
MKRAAVLLLVVALLVQVAVPRMLWPNNCPKPDGKMVCAFSGCYFNTEFCTINTFNFHRKERGLSVIKVISEGACNNETQTPYCLTVMF